MSEFAGAPELRSAAKELLLQTSLSRDLDVRLSAAVSLIKGGDRGEVARATEALAEIAEAQTVDTAHRQRALLALADANASDLAVPLCWAVLMERLDEPWQVRLAAISALVELEALDELLGVDPMPHSAGAEPLEGELVARGLGRIGAIRAQPRLIELLEEPEEAVRRAAAEALGAMGDLAAVSPLRRLAGSGRLLPMSAVRAAERAIQKIQSRAGGTQAGEISLAPLEPLEGAVSAADELDEGGEVSLAP